MFILYYHSNNTMPNESVKLIVDIPKDVHYKLKLKALKERTTIKDIVNILLSKSLQ